MSSSTPFLPARSWDTVVTPSCSPGDGDVRGSCFPCTPPSLCPAPLCDPGVLLSVPRGYLQPQSLFLALKSLLPVCPVPQSCSQHPQVQPQCSPVPPAPPSPTPVPPKTLLPGYPAVQFPGAPQHPQIQPWCSPVSLNPAPTPPTDITHQTPPQHTKSCLQCSPAPKQPSPVSPSTLNTLHQHLPVPPCLQQLSPVSHAPRAAQHPSQHAQSPPGPRCPQATDEGEGGVPAQAPGGLQQGPVRPQVPVKCCLCVPVAIVHGHLGAPTGALSTPGTCQGSVSPPLCSAPCPHWPPLRWAGPARRRIRATCPPAPRTGQGCPG